MSLMSDSPRNVNLNVGTFKLELRYDYFFQKNLVGRLDQESCHVICLISFRSILLTTHKLSIQLATKGEY